MKEGSSVSRLVLPAVDTEVADDVGGIADAAEGACGGMVWAGGPAKVIAIVFTHVAHPPDADEHRQFQRAHHPSHRVSAQVGPRAAPRRLQRTRTTSWRPSWLAPGGRRDGPPYRRHLPPHRRVVAVIPEPCPPARACVVRGALRVVVARRRLCRGAGPGASPHARLARQCEEWSGERRPKGAALTKYRNSNHARGRRSSGRARRRMVRVP